MAVYDSVVDRTGATALIPEDASNQIIQSATETSAVLQLARRLPDMPTSQRRLPVLNSLPTAYFVTGDTGLKQTTEVDWDNVYLNAEELAVIVPIPEAVIDDAGYPLFDQIQPLIVEALGVAIDAAVLFGTNKPSSWPSAILVGAAAASNTVDYSTQLAATDDLYDMVLGEGGTIAKVEEDGFMVNGHIAAMVMRSRLRGLRDTTGQPIFLRSMQDNTSYQLDGEPILFPRNGAFAPASALMISGDWTQLVYAMRQDITWKTLDQAVIQDQSGNILYNLAQQDMVALRCVVRLAFALPNPLNRLNQTDATRYPFAALVP